MKKKKNDIKNSALSYSYFFIVILGKDGHRLCGEAYCPLHRDRITGAATNVSIIVFALCKDGRRIPTQVTTTPIQNEAGEIIGGVETFRDVSPMLVDLEQAQKIQRQALQRDLPKDPRLRFSTFFMSYDIVGGDYYAIQPLDDDRYRFILHPFKKTLLKSFYISCLRTKRLFMIRGRTNS